MNFTVSIIKKFSAGFLIACQLLMVLGSFPFTARALTLLSDSFTGTTIDTAKWDVVGSGVSQNNVLSVSNSYVASTWGATALVSDNTFSRTGLEISAVMVGGSDQLLGYGDYNFQSAGTNAYIIDILGSGNGTQVYALSWSNGSLAGSNFSCGTATNGATYKMKIVTGGFEVYKNTGSGDSLLCSLSHNGSLTNQKIFLQAAASAATFDDLLVTDGQTDPVAPSAITDLTTDAGNAQVALDWTAPNDGGAAITDYLVDYRTASDPATWISFNDGTTTTSAATVTGLSNGTTYGFRVRSVNSAGTSTSSNIASSTPTAPTAPNAPTGVTAVAGNGQATISFTPGSSNGSAITGYTVGSSPGGFTATGASSPITVTGLTNGQAYTFTVTATNGIGTSASSSASNSVTPSEQIPPTIAALQLWLDFSDAATVASSASSVLVTDKSGVNRHASSTAAGTSPTLVSGVQNGLSVMRFDGNDYLRISTSTGYRTVFIVAKFDSTSFAAGAYPGLVGDFTGTSPNNGHIVNGIDGTTRLGIATSNFASAYRNGYTVAGTGGSPGGHSFSPLNEFWLGSFELSAAATNTTSAIGMINGAPDRYWDGDIGEVIVYNKVLTENERLAIEDYIGDKWGIAVATPPTAPDAISNLAATSTSPSNVVLTWTPPASNGSAITDYTIDYRVSGNVSWTNFVDGATTTASTTVTNLTASTVYQFRVRAVNGIGTAAESNIATATTSAPTVPSAPTIGTAVAGNGQATVSFTASTSTGGSAITGYTVTSSPGGITASGSSSPITVAGLTNGQSYTFTVYATNGVGNSASSAASNSVTPEVIAVPGQVPSLTAYGQNKQVNLAWGTTTDGGQSAISDYLVEYKLSTDSTWSTFSHTATTTRKISVTGLTNGSQYDFRVSAVNAGGSGTVSATATATPAAITTLAFVITGESNSGGIGLNSDATVGELATRTAVQITNLTSGQFLYESLDIGYNNLRDHAGLESYYDNSHGFELQLANSAVANDFPDHPQVYLTKTGQGGSQVSQWNVGGGYWNKFLERTAAAKTQLPANPTWVVWLSLGINDSIAGVATSTWKTAMIAHINKIKADLPGAIVILTEFQSMTAGSGYPAYNAVIQELADEQPNVFSVDTTGAGIRDGNHWSYAGLKTVASRMVTVTKNQLGLIYPGIPTSLGATPSSSQVALSWTAPVSNGGSAITDYVIEFKTSGASTWTTFNDGTSTTANTTVTGLSEGTAYNFRVSASNANGTGNVATVNSTTTDGSAPNISSVAAATATTSATITWTTNEQASSRVEYGLTNAYGSTTSETDTSPRVTSHSVTLSNLVGCTTYHYRVNSRDSQLNSATSSSSTFTTTGCTGSAAVVGQTQQAVTGASGGTVNHTASSGSVGVTVPAGATAGNVVYQVTQLDSEDVIEEAGVPTGLTSVNGYTFNLSAYGGVSSQITSFLQPITVEITYEDGMVEDFDESSLVMQRYSGGVWNTLSGCTLDTAANEISCTTSNFSIFSLFGTPRSSSGSSGSGGSSGGARRYGCKDTKALNYKQFVTHRQNLCVYATTPAGTLATTAGTQTSTQTAASVVITRDLEMGMKGADVQALQSLLIARGYLAADSATGFFGALTKAAVIAFQQANGIVPAAGYFGPVTKAALLSSPLGQTNPVSTPVAQSSTPVFSGSYTRDLDVGMQGDDVKQLQIFLNAKGHTVAQSGPGSKGNETTMFGYATQAALKQFQIDNGITPATGYFGPKTRAFLNSK